MAKTPRKIARYEKALSQWQAAGCPHPGDWPGKKRLPAFAKSDSWVEKSLQNGFLSNTKSTLPLFSKRLITLWDMTQHPADLIVHAMHRICRVKEDAVHHRERGYTWPKERRNDTIMLLSEAAVWLEMLNLGMSKEKVELLCRDLPHIDIQVAMGKADDIMNTLAQQLRERKFFVLNVDHNKFFDNNALAGDQFRSKFPNGNAELKEAGNCFALGRFKACVVQSCIACEAALVALGKRLKVKKQNDWGGWISAIRNELKARYTPRANRNRQFYAECAEKLDATRVATRNPASHFGLKTHYTETEAYETIHATCAFLRLVATKLKE